MLDLAKLEEKLDLALDSETTESLTDWLNSKRFIAFFRNNGEGQMVSKREMTGSFNVNLESALFTNQDLSNNISGNDNRFALAA